VDAYAARAYWNLDAAKLPYLKLAADRGLGTTDFESLLKRVASRSGTGSTSAGGLWHTDSR
jgi:hypothetical protein